MKNIPKDLFLRDIGFTVVFVDMGTSMNDAVHIQVEVIKVGYL